MSVQILVGDTRHVLSTLPPESVNCVVTSPPYWGLRDYGTARWEGGDDVCEHVVARKPPTAGSSSTLGYPAGGGVRRIAEGNTYHEAYTKTAAATCPACGARRIDSQIGLEPTPEAYVAELVAVFRETRRVLRADGTLWLNLGDTYAANRSYQVAGTNSGAKHATAQGFEGSAMRVPDGIKPKDLVGIPWRVAFALQADGWYLRSDIIWHKPNPMPESVTDRPTKAHEYVFLLTKSARYWYDLEAVREPVSPFNEGAVSVAPHGEHVAEMGHRKQEIRRYAEIKGANARTVWTIATQPFSGAHFATMPPALAERCIKAGCPEGGTVLDPFGGAGTTGLVADRLGRNAVLIELNPAYADMARKRIADDAPLITEVA